MKNLKVCLLTFILTILLVMGVNSCVSKKDISNATTYELQAIYGIGDKLAIQVHDYVEKYNVDRVSELKDKIPWLGDKRLEELKEVYK